jgi:hypothetical protein
MIKIQITTSLSIINVTKDITAFFMNAAIPLNNIAFYKLSIDKSNKTFTTYLSGVGEGC